MRAHLSLEATRGRRAKTVTRAARCPFGLDAVVAMLCDAPPAALRSRAIAWPGGPTVTFSNALACVRWRKCSEGVLRQAGCGTGLADLPKQVQKSCSPRWPRPHDGQ